MSDLLPNLVIVALVLAGLWYAFQPRYAFFVRIEAGRARVTAGKVTPAFLQRVAEACARNGVARGWVGGVQRRRRVSLVFSRTIPESCRQQLRNEWCLSG
jgi:hypothetical protein